MGQAVGGYVAGALTIAVIAGVVTYIVLLHPRCALQGSLVVIAGLFSLILLAPRLRRSSSAS